MGKLAEEHTGDKSEVTIVTHSSGNHAQAVALASKLQGVKAHIVMPVDAPVVKKQAVKGYGADITECVNTKEVCYKYFMRIFVAEKKRWKEEEIVQIQQSRNYE